MVDLESLILYIKIQPQSFLDSGREDFRVFFYHILTWQSSCSTVQNHLNKLSILLRQKAPCETWWTLAECFQRRRQDLCNQWRLRQPAHLCSLIRVFTDCYYLLQRPGYPKRDEWQPLPYWVDIQADLTLLVTQVLCDKIGFVVCWLKYQYFWIEKSYVTVNQKWS